MAQTLENDRISWSKLKYFYYIAKFGSFTQASKYLLLSQPALSRQIKTLEKQLNIKLFNKAGRGIILTSEGDKWFKLSETIMMQVRDTVQSKEHEEENPVGHLRVTCPHGFMDRTITRHMPGFLEKYPDVDVEIIGSKKNLDVGQREADVAITPTKSSNSNLIQEKLMTTHGRMYASKDYLAKFGTPENLEDLDHHRLIAVEKENDIFFQEYQTSYLLEAGRSKGDPRKPYLTVSTPNSQLNLGKEGSGIVMWIEESSLLKDSGLVQILTDVSPLTLDIYYTYPIHLKNLKRVTALKDYLMELIKNDIL